MIHQRENELLFGLSRMVFAGVPKATVEGVVYSLITFPQDLCLLAEILQFQLFLLANKL